MPVDPDLRILIDAMPETGLTGMDAVTLRELTKSAFAGQSPTEEVATVEDRTIHGPGGELPLRIYTPAGTPPFGVLVFFHGGG